MGRVRRWVVLGAFIGGAALWPVSGVAKAPTPGNAIRFQLVHDYLIVVPVFVNGTGPWDFLLDTGCSSTVIDVELGRRLNAPMAGQATVAFLTGMRHDQRVQLNEIRVGSGVESWNASGMTARVDKMENARELVPGVRGILGEDFLRKFDVLIDYERRLLHFNEPAPDGERIPFQDASRFGERRTINRLLVEVEFPGTGSGPVVMQLDTAARIIELFPASHVALLHLAHAWEQGTRSIGGEDPDVMAIYEHATIKIGTTRMYDLRVVQAGIKVQSDAVGLLPPVLFRRIYISHSGKFVVLNPTPAKQLQRDLDVEEAKSGAH